MAKGKSKRQRARRASARRMTRGASEGLCDAIELIDEGRLDEALESLIELDERYPKRAGILKALLSVHAQLGDLPEAIACAERAARLTPGDADVQSLLGEFYALEGYPALALVAMRRALELGCLPENAPIVREQLRKLIPLVDSLLAEIDLTGDDRLELATLHESVRRAIDTGRYQEAHQLAERLLARRPDFTPALNNKAMMAYTLGRADEAIAASRKVLELQPDNFHALANLARFLCLTGHPEEAAALAGRLKRVQSASTDLVIKQLECFSYLGDDQAVVAAFDEARSSPRAKELLATGQAWHLAAVAQARLGREKEACQLWQEARRLWPDWQIVEDQLDDLRLPIGQRAGPWAFEMPYWLSVGYQDDLLAFVEELKQDAGRKCAAARRLLERRPELNHLVVCLLDRGDPHGRQMALELASAAETPEMLAALAAFAFSQRGPDMLRVKALDPLRRAGLIGDEPQRLWMQGKWTEAVTLGYEIYADGDNDLDDESDELLTRAHEALQRRDGAAAEPLLRELARRCPDLPTAHNNLGIALQLQRRFTEAQEIANQMLDRFPDYFFAHVACIQEDIRQNRLSDARRKLNELSTRKRLHISEFRALCQAHIMMAVIEGRDDVVESWVGMWEASARQVLGEEQVEDLRPPKLAKAASSLIRLIKKL